MTPKEKAKELVDRFINQMPKYLQGKLGRLTAIQSALICVDEMLQFDLRFFDIEFLKEVKQEINKL